MAQRLTGQDIHSLVCNARADPGAAMAFAEQFKIVQGRLLTLVDHSAKQASDRTRVQQGTVTLAGVERKLEANFIKDALFLSDLLDVNEVYAVEVLLRAKQQQQQTTVSSGQAVDAAVLIHYDDQMYLLLALELVLTSSKDASLPTATQEVFQRLALELMHAPVEIDTNTTTTLASKLLKTSDALKTLEAQIRSTGVSTSMPLTTYSGVLGTNMTAKRLAQLRDQRICVVRILYHLASLFELPHDVIFAILDQFSLMDLTEPTVCYWMATMLTVLAPRHFVDASMAPSTTTTSTTTSTTTTTTQEAASKDTDSLQTDVAFLDEFHNRFFSSRWRVPALKGTIALQWCAFLASARITYASVTELSVTARLDLDELMDHALATDVLAFLNNFVLYFQQSYADVDTDRHSIKAKVFEEREQRSMMMDDQNVVDAANFSLYNADIQPEFQPFILNELETMCLALILSMGHHLRVMRLREDDARQQHLLARTDSASPSSPGIVLGSQMVMDHDDSQEQANEEVPFCGFEQFFTVLGTLYRHRPNHGLKFWIRTDNALHLFLKNAMEVNPMSTCSASLYFFSAISTGDACAPLAHELFDAATDRSNMESSPLFSWGKLFTSLQYFHTVLNASSSIDPRDEPLVIHFLGLLKQVVLYSPVARRALWTDPVYKARDTILQLISRPISSLLRAALLQTLAAFATSWGGGIDGLGAAIAGEIWTALEASNYLIPKPLLSSSSPPSRPATFWHTLATEQTRDQGYHETLAMLRLLGASIHPATQRDDMQYGFPPMVSTVPHDLGLGTRRHGPPGAQPYIDLVTEVLEQLPQLPYTQAGTRWQLTAACLSILCNSVDGFDLQLVSSLQSQAADAAAATAGKTTAPTDKRRDMQALLLRYVTHPGYSVLLGILSGGKLAKSLFSLMDHAMARVADPKAYGRYYKKTLQRCLTLFYRTLQLQHGFCNVLVPALAQWADHTGTASFKLLDIVINNTVSATLVPLGDQLLSHTHCLVQMALLMNANVDDADVDVDDDSNLCSLSTRTIDALATGTVLPLPARVGSAPHGKEIEKGVAALHTSPTPISPIGARLARILYACKDAAAIALGVQARLAIDQPEITQLRDYLYDINNIPFWLAPVADARPYDDDDDDAASSEDDPRTMTAHVSSVRIAMLDLLANSAAAAADPNSEHTVFNMAGFLLGFMGPSVPPAVLHEMLRLMHVPSSLLASLTLSTDDNDDDNDQQQQHASATAIAMMDEDDEWQKDEKDALLTRTHPLLAEKCYRLVYHLCSHASFASNTLRQLRNDHDFFYRQSAALYGRLEADAGCFNALLPGRMILPDGSAIASDALRLPAVLHQRAYFLDTLALELHQLASLNDKTSIVRLLDPLFRPDTASWIPALHVPSAQPMASASTSSSHRVSQGKPFAQQPCSKVVEMLSSLDFRWEDGLVDGIADGWQTALFPHFDASALLTATSARGCKVYDMPAIYAILCHYIQDEQHQQHQQQQQQQQSSFQQPFHQEGQQKDASAILEGMKDEMHRILALLMADNHAREVVHGRLHCLRAWKNVMSVALLECAEFIPAERYEAIVFDVLRVLFPAFQQWRVHGKNDDILTALSELIATLLDRLAAFHDKEHKDSSTSTTKTTRQHIGSSLRLSNDQLTFLFTSVIDCIDPDTTSVAMRGDFYMALVSILQYARVAYSVSATHHRILLERSLTDILANHYRVLMPVLCNDACDGMGVWRTTALIALASLHQLTLDTQANHFLPQLMRANFLPMIIDTIKHEDQQLARIIAGTHTSLLAQYIYEAKLTFLTRIASTRVGAQYLIDNALMDTIGRCDFLRARPADTNRIPIYNQLLHSTLLLVSAAATAIGNLNGSLLKKVEQFVRLQQEMLIAVMHFDLAKTSFEQLELMHLVTNLLYRLSCRPGYFRQMLLHNLSAVHAAMTRISSLPPAVTIIAHIKPTTEEQVAWSRIPANSAHPAVSLFAQKTQNLIQKITLCWQLYDTNHELDRQ
ncbi:nucleoporin Nup186/Nup192/Nup205 [Gongronella butleri]|nr:nucleoporin Nup186/Nup192/Nup205 [Gongronella butleri]